MGLPLTEMGESQVEQFWVVVIVMEVQNLDLSTLN